MATPLLTLAIALTFSKTKRTVYFVDFRAETYSPVTRTSILRSKGRIDERTWSLLVSTLRATVARRHLVKPILDEEKIRLMLRDDQGHRWFIDQSGRILSSTGSSGILSKKDLALLDRTLVKHFVAQSGT